jgi:hypothetical protein
MVCRRASQRRSRHYRMPECDAGRLTSGVSTDLSRRVTPGPSASSSRPGSEIPTSCNGTRSALSPQRSIARSGIGCGPSTGTAGDVPGARYELRSGLRQPLHRRPGVVASGGGTGWPAGERGSVTATTAAQGDPRLGATGREAGPRYFRARAPDDRARRGRPARWGQPLPGREHGPLIGRFPGRPGQWRHAHTALGVGDGAGARQLDQGPTPLKLSGVMRST